MRLGKAVKKTIKKKTAAKGEPEKKKRGRPAGSKGKEKKPKPQKVKKKTAPKEAKEAEPGKPLKFTYFSVMAKGLQPVLCLEVGGVPFTGGAVEDWKALKPTTPFGQLPLLEDETAGVAMAQSVAICNYIGKKAGSLGATDAEFALSQMLMQEAEDLYNLMQKFVATKFVPIDNEKKQGLEGFKNFVDETFPKHAKALEALLKGKKFTKSGTTVGELYLFGMLHQMVLVEEKCLDSTPELQAFYQGLLKNSKVQLVLDGSSAYGKWDQYFVAP